MLFCKDIELACDEKATKDMDDSLRADYCQALLNCSSHGRKRIVCPVAFGEVGVKDRVKSVLNYKKPAFWMILLSIAAAIVIAICFMTNPKSDSSQLTISEVTNLDEFLLEQNISISYTDDIEYYILSDTSVLIVDNRNADCRLYTHSSVNADMDTEGILKVVVTDSMAVSEGDISGRYAVVIESRNGISDVEIIKNTLDNKYSDEEAGVREERTESEANDSNSWEIVEIEGEDDSFVTSAADLYDTGGYGWYECQTSGYYYFNSMGNIYDNKSPRKEERLVWKVFITDEPLYETPTGIPANWERLYKHADGAYIEAGQYIIVSCSQNSKSYGYGLSGDDEALFTGELR